MKVSLVAEVEVSWMGQALGFYFRPWTKRSDGANDDFKSFEVSQGDAESKATVLDLGCIH